MRKLFSLLLVLMLVLGLTACSDSPPSASPSNDAGQGAPTDGEAPQPAGGGEGQYKVAIMVDSQQLDFFAYLIAACNKRGEELGVQVDVFDGQGDYNKVADFFDQVIQLQYDCIITCGDQALIPSVLDANAAGIPVVNFDQKLPEGEFVARVSSDNAGMGVALGKYAVQYLTEKNGEPTGVVMSLVCPTRATQMLRNEGFKSVIDQYPDIEYTEELLENHMAEPTQRRIDDVLIRVKPGEVDLMMGCNSGGALGGLAAVVSAGRTEIEFIGIDDEEGQLMALQDPDNPYTVTMAQNPMLIGRTCMDVAYDYLVNGTVAGDVEVECTMVTKETVDDFIAETEAEKAALEPYMAK